MDYFNATKNYRLINLASQLKTPTLIRIDINLPVTNNRISENNMRMQVYEHVLELLSDYVGLVVMSHQGRPGSKGFIPLKQHWIILRKMLPTDVDIEYIPRDEVFTQKTRKKIKNLRERQIILLDNVRMFDEEFKFDPNTSTYVKFFKGTIRTCVNDSIPCWHRDNSSLMCLPYIARTYVGVRSTYELKALFDINSGNYNDKAIIMGGAKLAKTSYLLKILTHMEGFTGGVPGELIARADGHDLGKKNNEFLKNRFKPEDFKTAKMLLKKFNVQYPKDFVVQENGENKIIPIDEMHNTKGLIMDIGPETVDDYAKKLQEKIVRIRAGPLGVYEKKYDNGIKLTKMIAGNGLIFLGGDTCQEVIDYGIDRHIADTGGIILISGGAFLHGMAGESYPSVDLILKKTGAAI